MKTNFGQIVKGVVVEIGSGQNEGKVKIRVPNFHGPNIANILPEEAVKYRVEDDQLPWAEVMYSPGVSNPSPDLFQQGEVVYVIFTSTSYRYPLVIGTTGRFM